MPQTPNFVIGLGPSTNALTILTPNLTQIFLEGEFDPNNPPELGQSLITNDETGVLSAGSDCLHYTDFEDLTKDVMNTTNWEALLSHTLQWRGTGTITEAVISPQFPSIVYLVGLNQACHRPPEMKENFTGKVFAFKAGSLDLQVEPLVDFGWVESLEREGTEIKVCTVTQSAKGWGTGQGAKRKYRYFSELELLSLWRTKFLHPNLLGKAIDLQTWELLPLFPDHPVPRPTFNLKVTTNHPYAANYIIDSGTIQLITDVVVRNFNKGK